MFATVANDVVVCFGECYILSLVGGLRIAFEMQHPLAWALALTTRSSVMKSAAQLLEQFFALGWDVPAEHQQLVRDLAKLVDHDEKGRQTVSAWPDTLKAASPQELLHHVYEACRAFSGGTLTVRSFDKWVEEEVDRTGAKEIKSAYHKLTGRLKLEQQHVGVFLDCMFRRWGALSTLSRQPPSQPMAHGLKPRKGSSTPAYYGLPVSDPVALRDRIVREIYPSTQAPKETFLLEENSARIYVGRFNIILGPPRGWAMQAFNAWTTKVLAESKTTEAHGMVVFVIDLGGLKSSEPRDFHAFYNLMEVHATLMSLAVFSDDTLGQEPRGKSPWTGASLRSGPRSSTVDLWAKLHTRIAIAIANLPPSIKRTMLENAKSDFNDDAQAKVLMEAAANAEFGIEARHIFQQPRAGLRQMLDAAKLDHAEFFALNVWVRSETGPTGNGDRPDTKIEHNFLWTPPQLRGALDTLDKDALNWWDDGQQYAFGSPVQLFEDLQCEQAFLMLQQAAAFRLRHKNLTAEDLEQGIKSVAYLSRKEIDISLLNLNEFLSLPSELYKQLGAKTKV
jgi:hypothetical protein